MYHVLGQASEIPVGNVELTGPRFQTFSYLSGHVFMKLQCTKPGCGLTFEASTFRGYCGECVAQYKEFKAKMGRCHRPAPGICLDGQFAPVSDCPRSVTEPVTGHQCCPICGSIELEFGYGLGTGYGFGAYQYCCGCKSFIDFVPDADDEDCDNPDPGTKLVEAPRKK